LGKNTLFYFPDKKGRLFLKSERPHLVYCPWYSCIFADKIRWENTIGLLIINYQKYVRTDLEIVIVSFS
jgi:hypothetical protein